MRLGNLRVQKHKTHSRKLTSYTFEFSYIPKHILENIRSIEMANVLPKLVVSIQIVWQI
jgi:hypothetical protein